MPVEEIVDAVRYSLDPRFYPFDLLEQLDLGYAPAPERWTSMSVERREPGLDSGNSTDDFVILEHPTPGFWDVRPELFIQVEGGSANLFWTPIGGSLFRLEQSPQPLFTDEGMITSTTLSDTTYTIPVADPPRFFRVFRIH